MKNMHISAIFLVLVLCQPSCLFAQAVLPKPAVDPTAGVWKYKITSEPPATWKSKVTPSTDTLTFSTTIKDDGGAWTVTTHWETPDGPVTDVQTLEKGTLILRKEFLKHFPKPGQPWKPVEINLEFSAHKATGTMKYVSGEEKSIAMNLGGPAFGGNAGSDVTIGCLPLADGYSTTLRSFHIDRVAVNPQSSDKEKLEQLKVVGMERVTVPAGTFDSYKIEVTSADGGSDKRTVWIAKDSRTPVKDSGSQTVGRGPTFSTTVELLP